METIEVDIRRDGGALWVHRPGWASEAPWHRVLGKPTQWVKSGDWYEIPNSPTQKYQMKGHVGLYRFQQVSETKGVFTSAREYQSADDLRDAIASC